MKIYKHKIFHTTFFALVLGAFGSTTALAQTPQTCPTSGGKAYGYTILPWTAIGQQNDGNWSADLTMSNTSTETVGFQGQLINANGFASLNLAEQIMTKPFNSPVQPSQYFGSPAVPPGGQAPFNLLKPARCDAQGKNCIEAPNEIRTGAIRVLVTAATCAAVNQVLNTQSIQEKFFWTPNAGGSRIRQTTLFATREDNAGTLVSSAFQVTTPDKKENNPSYKGTGLAVANLGPPQVVRLTLLDPDGKKILSLLTPTAIPTGGQFAAIAQDYFGSAMFPSGFSGDYPFTVHYEGVSGGKIVPFTLQFDGDVSASTSGATILK